MVKIMANMITIHYRSIDIQRLHRDHHAESNFQLVEKAEYYLLSCPAEEWARVIPGRADNRDTFIYNSELNKISLNTPVSPLGANGISAIAPRQEAYGAIKFGNTGTKIITDNVAYPCLRIASQRQAESSNNPIPFAQEAKQLAPVLGIRGSWDDPILRKNDLRWKESKIEYIMLNRIPNRMLLPVKDYDGSIRNLIEIRQSPDMVQPLSFAQNMNYSAPMQCGFSFDPAWYLLNSEYLSQFPNAEVIISNELGVVLGNKPDMQTIVLGYAFGYEMIAHLKLEGLRHRNIILLVIEPPDKAVFRENLREAVALLSRFCELDIPVCIEYAKCSSSVENITGKKCIFAGKEYELNFIDEHYTGSFLISKDDLIKMVMAHQIYIPDNIRLDRLGRIPDHEQIPIIADMLDSGSTTAIIAHDGVDVSRICGSIAAGIFAHAGYIFPKRWKIMSNDCRYYPAVLTASGTQAGIEKTLASLHAKNCLLYTLPYGTKEEIEQRLTAIRHETGANIFIFSGNKILAEQKKLLEIASVWTQKSSGGMMICCDVKSGAGASDFLDEICARKFHIFRLRSDDLAYLVKEDDPFSENPQIFKLVLKHGAWTTETPTESDKLQARNEMSVNQDYGERKAYQENEIENKLKNLI